jgi:hypothetical protein
MEPRFAKQWQAHLQKKAELQEKYEQEGLVLRDLQEQYCQYEYMVELLSKRVRRVVKKMIRRATEMKTEPELETEAIELMTGLENTLRVMMVNATEMIRSSDDSREIVETQHWARRERFCAGLIELITGRSSTTRCEDRQQEGSMLGQSNALLYGGGTVRPGKEE